MNRLASFYLVAFVAIVLSAPVYATNYYLSPSGDDGASGLSPSAAWATLQHAQTIMVAGDTLFIMGGTYSTPQHFHRYNGQGGTAGNPLVFKAYGDSRAIFQYTGGGGRQYNRYWYFEGGADYVVIDGFGYLAPHDSLMIKLEGREDASYVVRFVGTSSNWTEHITVRGIEIDGNFPTPDMFYPEGGLMRYAIGWTFGRMDTLTSCYIHHVYHATGDIYPGDNTDRAQGTGEAVFLQSCERILISRNTFGNANHAAISVAKLDTDSQPSRYIKIVNNRCDNRWGGGFYLANATEYSLLEGNVVVHCGETTTKTKGAFYVAGPHNTVRRNVAYVPQHDAIGIKAAGWGGTCQITDSTLLYNNTFFGCKGQSVLILVNNTGAYSCATAHNWGSQIANNILYKSWGVTPDVGNREAELSLYLYDSNEPNNWIDPDARGTSPASTHFGGNKFYHNVIRKDGHPPDWNQAVVYVEDADYGGISTFSLGGLESLDPVAWFANTGADPMLMSESPDSYGLFDGWWRLRSNSPCIDSGARIRDTNGSYVESLYPGYGWRDLSFAGTAPDIGAHEYTSEDPAPFLGPHQNRLQPIPPPR